MKTYRRRTQLKPANEPYVRVNLTMTPQEKERLWVMANDKALPVNEFIRRCIFGEEYRQNPDKHEPIKQEHERKNKEVKGFWGV